MALALLILVTFLAAANGQLQVNASWSGALITGPVLIYHDEILVDSGPSYSLGDLDRVGALVCRSGTRVRASWQNTDGYFFGDVNNDGVTSTSGHQLIRSGPSTVPSVARLSRANSSVNPTAANQNGLWVCRVIVVPSDGAEGLQDVLNNFVFAGLYRSGSGVITSIAITLADSPSFTGDSPTFTLFGDTSGGPPETYTWTRNGREVTDGGSFSISIAVNTVLADNATSANMDAYRNTRYRSTLTVTGTLPGVYQYSVSNRAMNNPMTDSFDVQAVFTPNASVSILNATSATISWEFSLPASRYTLVLNRIGGSGLCPNHTDSRDTAPSPTDTSMSFTDLQEFSNYRFTLTTVFNVSDREDTREVSMNFTTPSAAPTGVPRSLISDVDSTEIIVGWDVINCIDCNGNITGYTVEFQGQGGASIPGEVTGREFSASELTPGRTYIFRVAGVNSDGTGPFTNEVYYTTEEEIPGPVSDFMVQPKSSSILFTWGVPDEPNGVIIRYEVTYRINGGNLVTLDSMGVATNFTILSLIPNTRISDISVAAYTRIGRGPVVMWPALLTPPTPTTTTGGVFSMVAITATATFLLTILLYTTVLLVVCAVCRCSQSASKTRSAKNPGNEEKDDTYEEIPNCKTVGEVELKGNLAYNFMSTKQPNIEEEQFYDTVLP